MRMPGRGLCLVLLLSAAPSAAVAGWARWSGGSGDRVLYGVSAPSAIDVFTIGMHFDTTGMIPMPVPHVFASQDGGHVFTEITGNLGGGTLFFIPSCLQFLDSQHGFVAGGSTLYATDNRGGAWSSRAAGFELAGLHFFDYENGVVFGEGGTVMATSDGGNTLTPQASGTTVALHQSFWLDRQRGFIAGFDERVEEDPYGGPSTTTLEHGVILRTTNGGATWAAGAAIEGVGLGEPFFLGDGLRGWVSAWRWIDDDKTEARLYWTADGGLSWADLGLPIQVGTLHMFMDAPINTHHIAAMHWADALHGHLGSTAFIFKASDGQNDTRYWRTLDYLTADGGATWTKTDLGTITVELSGGPPAIQNDGVIAAGAMRSFYDGVMVGERQSVWGYEYACTTAGDCPPGYACALDKCVPPVATCSPPCSSGETCMDGVCLATGGDADHRGGDGRSSSGGAKEFQNEGCSCRAGSSAAPGAAGLLVLAVALSGTRHRRRGPA